MQWMWHFATDMDTSLFVPLAVEELYFDENLKKCLQ